jgi:antirestriction protein ArdC
MQKTDIAKVITDSIIEQLENGVAPWVKPWASKPSEGAPHNPSTKTNYRGINFIWLSLMQSAGDFGTSSQWMTYKQAQKMGAQVSSRAKGKGVQVVFYKPLSVTDKTDSTVTRLIPMLKSYTVFNLDWIDGLPDNPVVESLVTEFQSLEECERFIENTKAVIKHGGDSAFYTPAMDFIQLPNKTDFKSNSDYYATALHELSHWTGHNSRVNRDFSKSKRFGDSAYAFEELVAELSAAMMCAHLKVDGQLQHASYIQSWLKVLKQDSKAILKASAEAQKAVDYLCNTVALGEEGLLDTDSIQDSVAA